MIHHGTTASRPNSVVGLLSVALCLERRPASIWQTRAILEHDEIVSRSKLRLKIGPNGEGARVTVRARSLNEQRNHKLARSKRELARWALV